MAEKLGDAQSLSHDASIEKVQRVTGWLSLACIDQLHVAAAQAIAPSAGTEQPALFGARDLTTIKRLLTVAFAWLVIPAIESYDASYDVLYPSSARAMSNTQRIHEASDDDSSMEKASETLMRIAQVFCELFQRAPSAVSNTALPVSDVARTDIAVLVLRVYFVDVLRVFLRISFGPSAAVPFPTKETIQNRLHELLEALPTSVNLAVLRSVPAVSALSSHVRGGAPRVPGFVRENCARLLSAQLLRPEGVRSLLIGLLGANEADMLSGDLNDDAGDSDSMYID